MSNENWELGKIDDDITDGIKVWKCLIHQSAYFISNNIDGKDEPRCPKCYDELEEKIKSLEEQIENMEKISHKKSRKIKNKIFEMSDFTPENTGDKQ